MGLLMMGLALLWMVGCGGSTNSNANNNNAGTDSGTGGATGSSNPGNNGGTGNTGGSTGGTTTGTAGGTSSGGTSTGSNSGGTSGTGNSGSGASAANQFLYGGSLAVGVGVQGYKIDASTGALTPLSGSPFTSGLAPYPIAVDPANKFLYAAISQQPAVRGANCSDAMAQLYSYTIGSDGSLAPLEQLTLTTYCATEVVIDPSGKNLYVMTTDLTQFGGMMVVAYSIGPDGKLTALPDSPYHLTSTPSLGVFSSDGRFLYARTDGGPSNGLVVLQRSSSGALTEVQTVPWASNSYVFNLALVAGGKYLLVTSALDSTDAAVHEFAVDQSTGKLSPKQTFTGEKFASAGTLLPDRSGQYVLIGLYMGGINTFKVGDDGSLTFAGSGANSARTLSMAIDATNHFVYVQNNDNSVSALTFDATTGNLTPIAGSPFTTPTQLVSPVVVKK